MHAMLEGVVGAIRPCLSSRCRQVGWSLPVPCLFIWCCVPGMLATCCIMLWQLAGGTALLALEAHRLRVLCRSRPELG
jgi:hypothetical protein